MRSFGPSIQVRGLRALLAVGVVVAAGVSTSVAGAQSLDVTTVAGVAFPDRTLVVSVPPGPTVSPGRVHVLENGVPVSRLGVTPLTRANIGDFGVEVVIDSDPSMGGPVMANAMAAARALAAQRTGNQQLGVVFSRIQGTASSSLSPASAGIGSGGQGTVVLPLTSDPQAIGRALSQRLQVGAGTHLLPAITLAIGQLTSARIAAGAVILLTDDIDNEPTPQAVAAMAKASHVRIYVVGVRDRAFTPKAMSEIAKAGGGQFFQATPSQLSGVFTQIQSVLASRYVIHYRSAQPLGGEVTMSMRVDGVPDIFTTTYATPLPPGRDKQTATRHPFWASTLAMLLAACACALLLATAAGLLFSHFARSDTVTSRVTEFAPTRPKPTTESSGWLASGALRQTERALSARSWWPAFAEDVDIARMARSPIQLVYLAGLGSFVAAALLMLATGSPLAGIPGLPIGPFALRAVLNFRIRKQRALFENQVASHLEEIAASMRSGRSLLEALEIGSANSDDPTRREFERALANERLGLPLEEVLRPIAHRMKSDGTEQLAVIAAMQRRSGSSAAEALERVAEGARERDALRREVAALTAQGRLARWILSALPPVLLLAFRLINPSYVHPLFHTTAGVVLVGVGAVMCVAGSLVMKRIVEIEV